jgi:hypothetical protein
MKHNSLATLLKELRACNEAVKWSAQYKTLAEAWPQCERADWLLWLCANMAGEPGWPTHKQVVYAACQCARTALPYTTAPQALTCIEVTEAWTRGEATINDVRAAAAYAYAATAAAYAANAATFAAYAYAATAAAYAANAAAYAANAAAAKAATKAHKEMCKIIRSILKPEGTQ